jgi:hypothetical protein
MSTTGSRSTHRDCDDRLPSDELEPMLRRAAAENWQGAATDGLAAAIEHRIIGQLPSRLRSGLGPGEAESVAWLAAWTRCRELAEELPKRLTWGFLANHVRWRVADRLTAELLRAQRHPLTDELPERATPGPADVDGLGPALEALVDALEAIGFDRADSWIATALDGGRLGLLTITDRLVEAGASRAQADALAVLMRGGRGAVSVVARVARGEDPDAVFAESTVRRRMAKLVPGPADAEHPGGLPLGHRRGTRHDQPASHSRVPAGCSKFMPRQPLI